MDLKLISTSGTEPVLLEEAKDHLGVAQSFTADNDLINAFISAARERAESYCNRSFINKTYELYLDAWPNNASYYSGIHSWVKLPRAPVKAVTKVEYKVNGSYSLYEGLTQLNDATLPPKLYFMAPLPTVDNVPMSIKITYTTGYESEDLPKAIKVAILMMVRTMYDHREDQVKGTIMSKVLYNSEYLLNPYRIFEFM